MALQSANITTALSVQAAGLQIGAPFQAKIPSVQAPYAFGIGSAAGQCQKAGGVLGLALTANTPLTINTLAVATAGWAGDTAFAGIVSVAIEVLTGTVKIGNANTNSAQCGISASGTLTVPAAPGLPTILTNPGAGGWTTTSAQSLQLDPGASNATVNLVILGT